jgi:hypothetical protein
MVTDVPANETGALQNFYSGLQEAEKGRFRPRYAGEI